MLLLRFDCRHGLRCGNDSGYSHHLDHGNCRDELLLWKERIDCRAAGHQRSDTSTQ
jgi:hypothetical protein